MPATNRNQYADELNDPHHIVAARLGVLIGRGSYLADVLPPAGVNRSCDFSLTDVAKWLVGGCASAETMTTRFGILRMPR
jgi:hypothetical protein